LVVERWLQLPPSEETRAWATVVASLEKEGIAEPGAHLAALRSFQTVLILAKRTPLTEQDLAEIRQFAQAQGYDLVYLPDINREEANRFHIIPEDPYFRAFQEILDPAKRSDFFHRHPYDVRPASDGRPFFFHYFRLTQIPAILASFGRVWQPFGGGGYLVLVVLLGLALAASSVFILLPLALRSPPKEALPLPGRARVAVFSYFAALGLAYLLVELPLLQYFILLLGQPIYALALVLAVLLGSSVLGSLWGEGRSRLWLAALAPLVGLYALFLGRWLPSLLGLAFPLRALSGVVLLAPLGALMGMPFPAGIRALGSFAPRYIPWAWAVNGCASVVGSILATMLAVSFGFAPVLGLAAGL
ncbi:MAG: hypothetical protein Q8O76_05930, partial [Chloroflexota bacterium]|nr:hypothetical protein [Chloroflexota bacterium]